MRSFSALLLPAILACQSEEPPPVSDTGPSQEFISASAWFTRASLDARGHRPSLEELDSLPVDSDDISDTVTQLADSPLLGQRLAWMWNERVHSIMWATQVDRFESYEDEAWTLENIRVAGQEVLQFMRLLVDEDRSLRELVTADAVPVHSGSPPFWPTSAGDDEWRWGSYIDNRPVSGILSSPAMWLRYTGDALNYQRLRANAVSTIFLCKDFFDKTTGFNFVFNGSESSIEDAVKTDRACLHCHSTLDPLGAHFGGFSERSLSFSSEAFLGYSEFNNDWTVSLTQPSYFGHKSNGLESLGQFIAADPRFSHCMVETLYEGLVGLPFSEEPEADQLVQLFTDNDLVARPLVREILSLKSYRSRADRLLTNTQMRSNWMHQLGVRSGDQAESILDDLLWKPELGIMGGAGDDLDVLTPNREASLSRAVLNEWAAKSIAEEVVEADRDRDIADQVLLGFELPLSDEQTLSVLSRWISLFTSQDFDESSEEVQRLHELYLELGGGSSASQGAQAEALSFTLEALLQHPMSQVY